MAAIDLRVFICSKPAGILRQGSEGSITFQYDDSYQGPPLSLSMPISNRIYGQKVVKPYLFGLLPDSEQQRRAIAAEYGVRPNNPLALLTYIGLDCPGGVQFCRIGDEKSITARLEAYRSFDNHEIALKLKRIRENEDASWMGRDESWSLGGNQGKFALALRDGVWCGCLGSSPTTHIFKNGVMGFRLQALNEYICMKTARRVNIPAAGVEYRLFDDEAALIIERYDRVKTPDGRIVRLHQEDLCQALGIMPDQKYAADGGPSSYDVLELLSRTSSCELNLQHFTKMLFFNCLIGAPDAHAKNYSVLLGQNGSALLSPMYDVASGLAYENMRRKGRLAMAVGGENRFGRIGSGAIHRYAGGNNPELAALLEKAGLTEQFCMTCMASLAQSVPAAMSEAFDKAETQDIVGVPELREHLLGPVTENCARTLALL